MPPIFLKLYQHALVWSTPLGFLYISLINPFPAGLRLGREYPIKSRLIPPSISVSINHYYCMSLYNP